MVRIISAGCSLTLILALVYPHITANANRDRSGIQQQADHVVKEFAHLIRRAGESRQVHLSSELVEDGVRVQVEEFLDLNSYNQLIQFKWNSRYGREPDSNSEGNVARKGLLTNKVNLLILNQGSSQDQPPIMYTYSDYPFQCKLQKLSHDDHEANTNWIELVQTNGTVSELELIDLMIQSVSSTNRNSPYLVNMNADLGDSRGQIWLFGVAALWLKASFSSGLMKLNSSDAFRLDLPQSGIYVDFYQESSLLSGWFESGEQQHDSVSNNQYDLVNLIELYRKEPAASSLVHSINVVDVSFGFSRRLASNVFTVPIGFGCQQNPLINRNGVYFRERASQLMELEVMATRHGQARNPNNLDGAVELKTLELVQVRHPLNLSNELYGIHVHEEHTNYIQDSLARVAYSIKFNETGTSKCTIKHLADSQTSGVNSASYEVKFRHLGLSIPVNKARLNFLLALDDDDTQKGMRLLNVIESSELHYEFVYESDFTSDLELIRLTDQLTGQPIKTKLSIVRVYKQRALGGGGRLGPAKRMRRRGIIELDRVMVLVFNEHRTSKLAQLRFSLIREVPTMSFRRRAAKFDLSHCYRLARESVQLLASYPVDAKLMDHLRNSLEARQELVEQFYGAQPSHNYQRAMTAEDDQPKGESGPKLSMETFNFLRVPRVEVRISPDEQLELLVTLLDTLKPTQLFHGLDGMSFKNSEPDGCLPGDVSILLLVGSLEECSQFCRQLECKTLAYDTKQQCKLSTYSVYANSSPIEPAEDHFSQLFYWNSSEPMDPSGQVSLAKLRIALAHFQTELSSYHGLEANDDDLEDDNPETSLTRSKRQINSTEPPVLSFKFIDRSAMNTEFSPPRTILLIPSSVDLVTWHPALLDVSTDSARATKLAQSFRAQETGRCYRLAPQSGDPNNPIHDESGFVDPINKIHLTLRRLASPMDQQGCSLVCLNINHGDEQICTSFSYSANRRECVLVITTRISNSWLEANIGPRAGTGEPAVGDAEQMITSLDELLVDETGCLIAKRDYLPDFDGPIRVDLSTSGYKGTDQIEIESKGLKLEWLQVLANDASKFSEVGLSKDDCPRECLRRIDRSGRTCVAFDFCSELHLTHRSERRYRASCNLLLVETNYSGPARKVRLSERRAFAGKLDWLRARFNELQPKGEPNNQGTSNHLTPKLMESNCQRYFLSQLHNFNRLSQVKLETEGAKSYGLTLSEPSVDLFDLDSCALECSQLGSGNCLGFQYCLSIIPGGSDRRGPMVQQSCSFISALDNLEGNSKLARLNESAAQGVGVKPASRCHIYLVNFYESLEELEGNAAGLGQEGVFGKHLMLVVGFVFVYVGLIALFVYFVRRRQHSTIRKEMATTLTRINEQRRAV